MYYKVKTEIKLEDNTRYTYGIGYSDGEKTIKQINDISLNEEAIDRLADMLNDNDLAVEQLDDVVEDVLADPSFLDK